jgi:hypothetical protein
VSDQGVSGIANLGTGTPTEVVSNNQAYQINSPDTAADSTPPAGICPVGYSQCPVKHHHTNVSGKRVTWIERR